MCPNKHQVDREGKLIIFIVSVCSVEKADACVWWGICGRRSCGVSVQLFKDVESDGVIQFADGLRGHLGACVEVERYLQLDCVCGPGSRRMSEILELG